MEIVLLQDRRSGVGKYILRRKAGRKILTKPYKCRQNFEGVEAIKTQSVEKN